MGGDRCGRGHMGAGCMGVGGGGCWGLPVPSVHHDQQQLPQGHLSRQQVHHLQEG